MKCLWVHGTYFIKFEDDYYHHNLSKKIWEERYLAYFDSLTVCSRVQSISTSEQIRGKQLSIDKSENRVHFEKLNVPFLRANREKAHLQALLSEVDFVIVRVPSNNSNAVAKMAKKMGKPCFAEVVGCGWDACWTHGFTGRLAAPYAALLMRRTVRNADFALYVTSEFLQKRYPCGGLCCACSDVELLPLPEEQRKNRLQNCRTFNYERPVQLATIGAVDVQYKGQAYVIQAIAQLKKEGFRFVYRIIGGGDSTALQELAAQLDVEDSVIFTGNLTHTQVFDVLDQTDIYVHPSLTEGMPRSVLEAESRGCAVIGTNVGGIPEIVPAENLFAKKDVAGIAALLRGYTPERLAEEAKRNIRFAQKFAEENSMAKRDAFMQKVCASLQNKQ